MTSTNNNSSQQLIIAVVATITGAVALGLLYQQFSSNKKTTSSSQGGETTRRDQTAPSSQKKEDDDSTPANKLNGGNGELNKNGKAATMDATNSSKQQGSKQSAKSPKSGTKQEKREQPLLKKMSSLDTSNDDLDKKADLSQVESTLGTKAFKSGSFTLAIEHFSRAIDLCPEEDTGSKKVMLNNRAASREKLGEWAEAERDATAAITLDPHYRRAVLRRAKARENLDKYAEALEDYSMCKFLDSPTVTDEDRQQLIQSMDNLAQTLAKSESQRIWKKRFEAPLSSSPIEIPRAGVCRQYYYAFSMDARSMRAPPSLLAIKDAIERMDANSATYGEEQLKVAMLYKARLDVKEALALFESVAVSPTVSKEGKSRALAEIASIYHMVGHNRTAKEKLEAAKMLHETSQIYIKLAGLAVEEGEYAFSKELLEKAMRVIQNGAEIKNERADINFHKSAIACLEATDLSVARELLDSAISDVPDYGMAYMQLGVVLFRMGMVPEALEALEQACLLVPELAEVHNFLGEVLMTISRKEEAIHKFEEATNVDEHCALPLLNRGVMFMSIDGDVGQPPSEEELRQAIELFDRAVAADPSSEIAYIHRASYYCHAGDLKTALENYDKAIELTKSLPSLVEYLGFRCICAADLAAQLKLTSV